MLLGLIQLLLLFCLALIAATPFVLIVLLVKALGKRRRLRALAIVCAFALGVAGGGLLIWRLVHPAWTLPFFTTLSAAVDVETYGHTVEHAAENILVWMTFAGTLGGFLCAGATAVCGRRLKPFSG
jgi:hypothetical protein